MATEPSTALVLTEEAYEALQERRPAVAARLLTRIEGGIWGPGPGREERARARAIVARLPAGRRTGAAAQDSRSGPRRPQPFRLRGT